MDATVCLLEAFSRVPHSNTREDTNDTYGLSLSRMLLCRTHAIQMFLCFLYVYLLL